MPIRSMTGFGQAESMTSSGTFRVEIRAVNGRFLELQLRQPRILANLEQKIKKEISSSVSRGNVSVTITLDNQEENSFHLAWNKAVTDNYVRILRQIVREYDLKDDISLSSVLSFSDVIMAENAVTDEQRLWMDLAPVLSMALKNLEASREAEGKYIASDLKKMCVFIEKTTERISKRAPLRIRRYTRELKKRIDSLVGEVKVDPQRIAAEVAIMADKMDISEECTRLRSHLEKILENMQQNEPVGKRLNFLLQEMNREANTIGSKASDTVIAHDAVLLKEYVEKIREQIQNIE